MGGSYVQMRKVRVDQQFAEMLGPAKKAKKATRQSHAPAVDSLQRGSQRRRPLAVVDS